MDTFTTLARMLTNYACIFDLDGVLVHTAHFHYLAWKRLADKLGFDLTETHNESLKGLSRVDSLKQICAWANVELNPIDFETNMAMKNDWYLEMVNELDETAALPGVRAFIMSLKDAGMKLAVGSASKNARLILEKIQMTHYFDIIVDGTNTTRSKPDPQVFQLGAEAMNIGPKQTVVFEDSPSGIKAARSGGFRSIGVGAPANLDEADIVIPDFQNFTINSLSEFLSI